MCGGQLAFGNSGFPNVNTNTQNTGGGQSHDHTLSANFSGSANSVLQPYLVLIYIIKT
jgi:mRNA-degrading endonuclease YafQ of YafQ-DinJ toxin-antitoxin module